MNEIFKDIPGFEGRYQINPSGTRVISLKYKRWYGPTDLNIFINPKNGRRSATLFSDFKKPKPYKISYLVAITYIPNPNNLPEVHHIDHNKLNDNVDNLMWISTEGHKAIHDLENAKRIACYKNDKLYKIYNSIREVERDGFNRRSVQNILHGGLYKNGKWVNQYTTKGCFSFKYV